MRRILFRLLMIHVGIIVACFAAALAFGAIETWNVTIPESMTREEVHSALLFNSVIVALIGFFYAYLPSLVVGLLGEAFGVRTVILYAVVGGLIGLMPAFGMVPSWVTVDATGEALTSTPLTAYPAIGILGGCVYWLVAGCKAGFAETKTA